MPESSMVLVLLMNRSEAKKGEHIAAEER